MTPLDAMAHKPFLSMQTEKSYSMMNIITKIFLVAFAIAAPLGVEGNVEVSTTVECLPDSSAICVGTKIKSSPSPPIDCTDSNDLDSCASPGIDGYSWIYYFVKGLEEGPTDADTIEKAKTKLTVGVKMDKEQTNCEVKIKETACTSCSTEGCDDDSIKFDCTNILDGRDSSEECQSLDRLLYPLVDGSDAEPSNIEEISGATAALIVSNKGFGLISTVTMILSVMVTLL